MDRENRLVRLFRAFTDATQQELADDLGIHRVTLTQYEGGTIPPRPEHLELMAERARLTIEQGDEILQLYDILSQPRLRAGQGPEELFAGLGEPMRSYAHQAFQQLLRLRLPDRPPRAEDRVRGKELFGLIKNLTPSQRTAVVKISGEFQSWALCELVVKESLEAAAQDLDEAQSWAKLAVEIAERVPDHEGWRNRVQGYAAAALAHVLRAAGRAKEAEAALKEAQRLWSAGSDPDGLLDPSRLRLLTPGIFSDPD